LLTDYDYTIPLRLFQYLRNMGKKPSKQIALVPVLTYIQPTLVLVSILTIKDILFSIVSHMDESPLALALACRGLYASYIQSHNNHKCTMVRDSLCEDPPSPEYIGAVKGHLVKTGWKHEKVILEIVTLAELQKKNCKRFINAWCSDEKFTKPIGLFDANLEAILLEFTSKKARLGQNVSFVNFSNLTSFGLSGTNINSDMMSKLYELPSSLKFLSLCDCIMSQDCLSKLFKGRNSLEEIQLIRSEYIDLNPIEFPPGLKRLQLSHLEPSIDCLNKQRFFIVNLLPCIQIKYLTIRSSLLYVKLILSEIARLLELKLDCGLIDKDFGKSLDNLKTPYRC